MLGEFVKPFIGGAEDFEFLLNQFLQVFRLICPALIILLAVDRQFRDGGVQICQRELVVLAVPSVFSHNNLAVHLRNVRCRLLMVFGLNELPCHETGCGDNCADTKRFFHVMYLLFSYWRKASARHFCAITSLSAVSHAPLLHAAFLG